MPGRRFAPSLGGLHGTSTLANRTDGVTEQSAAWGRAENDFNLKQGNLGFQKLNQKIADLLRLLLLKPMSGSVDEVGGAHLRACV